MAYPVDAGITSHSGKMHPILWTKKLLVKYYKRCIYTEIANTNWEGEIRQQGDTVRINMTPDITITDHLIGETIVHEDPASDTIDLLIDKGKKWAFRASSVDKKQAAYNFVDDWTDAAAKDLHVAVDLEVMGSIYADAHASNSGATAGVDSGDIDLGVTGTPVVLTKANIIDYIIDLGTVLEEQNVPEDDCWVVLPPWAANLIKKSDLQDASHAGDSVSMARTGRIGKLDNMMIYKSRQLSSVVDGAATAFNAIFGHKQALTFASQLVESRGPLQDVAYFGDHYDGLHVFGFKVVKPDLLGHFYITKG